MSFPLSEYDKAGLARVVAWSAHFAERLREREPDGGASVSLFPDELLALSAGLEGISDEVSRFLAGADEVGPAAPLSLGVRDRARLAGLTVIEGGQK